jgi:hypothetical protein
MFSCFLLVKFHIFLKFSYIVRHFQFDEFLNVNDENNQPLAKPLPKYKQGPRPVVEVSACTKVINGHYRL